MQKSSFIFKMVQGLFYFQCSILCSLGHTQTFEDYMISNIVEEAKEVLTEIPQKIDIKRPCLSEAPEVVSSLASSSVTSPTNSPASTTPAIFKVLLPGVPGMVEISVTYPLVNLKNKKQVQDGLVKVAPENNPPAKFSLPKITFEKFTFKNMANLYKGYPLSLIRVAPQKGVMLGTNSFLQEQALAFKKTLRNENGPENDQAPKLNLLESMALGTASGIAGTVLVGCPMETLIIQKQFKEQSSFQAACEMVRSRGVKSFYRGLAPHLTRESIYSGIILGLTPTLKEKLAPLIPGEEKVVAATAASLSGLIAAFLSQGADTIKTRMQKDNLGEKYPNSWSAIKDVYINNHGIKGLWKGMWPRAMRTGIGTPIILMVKDAIDQKIQK